MNRDTFPEAVLNGQQLDLFALYREVATRGGFKCAAYIPPCHHPVIVFIFHVHIRALHRSSRVHLVCQLA